MKTWAFMRGTIVSGRNSSGGEAAPGCYNAEELLYDFLIIIIRNTSRGLLTVQPQFTTHYIKILLFAGVTRWFFLVWL